MEKEQSTRCTAKPAAGRACQAWAVRGTDPPRSAAHGGRPDREAKDAPGQSGLGELDLSELVVQIDDLDAALANLLAALGLIADGTTAA